MCVVFDVSGYFSVDLMCACDLCVFDEIVGVDVWKGDVELEMVVEDGVGEWILVCECVWEV